MGKTTAILIMYLPEIHVFTVLHATLNHMSKPMDFNNKLFWKLSFWVTVQIFKISLCFKEHLQMYVNYQIETIVLFIFPEYFLNGTHN